SEIKEIGVIMSSHCLYCSQHDKECVRSEKSIRCSECCRLGRRCVVNAGPSDRDWDKLHSERAKLKAAESRTRAEIRAAQSSIASLFAKIDRLERQRDFLESRAGKFLESEVKTVEELEHLEEEEKKRVAEQAEVQSLFASLTDLSPSNSFPELSDSFINSILREGVVDDTSRQSSGRS
ncbi:hypothetical protein LOZ66_006966, partial [Ophidiomyces ophidiicola]